MITSVFVYGTLKRGQCRESRWPVSPLSIRDGWCYGRLYDRSDYPATTAGHDRVGGELWSFAPEHIERVLKTLDLIEGSNQPGQADLYRRVVTEVWDRAGNALGAAWTYHYAVDPETDGFTPIVTTTDAPVHWPQ